VSGGRFVLKQIHVRGAGASDLTRYVAKSKLDHAREGRNPRELFTRTADNLTHSAAKEWLSITGGALEKREVLHYVLSFERGREYEVLGDDEDGRKRQIVAFVRRAVSESLRGIGIAEMRWVAGIHRNTGNPHVHLLLNKNAVALASRDLVRLPKLPAPVIAHYTNEADGRRNFSYGLLISSFAGHVDARHRDRVRSLLFENSIRNVRIARGLLAPEALRARLPTEEERLVGRWLVAEIETARTPMTQVLRGELMPDAAAPKAGAMQERKALMSRLGALRTEVARLDTAALAREQPVTPAFIETEQLRMMLTDPPRGLAIQSDELAPQLEKVRQAHAYSHQERGIKAHLHEANDKAVIPTTDAKEQSRIISPPSRTR
jgi:hypothetical protein